MFTMFIRNVCNITIAFLSIGTKLQYLQYILDPIYYTWIPKQILRSFCVESFTFTWLYPPPFMFRFNHAAFYLLISCKLYIENI